ncbi:hypothetical protein ACI65C_005452 [Semiaphis heraclei]
MNNKDFRYGTKKRRYLSKTIKSKKQKLKNFIKKKETPIVDHQVSDLGTPVAVDDEIISTGSNYLQKDDNQTQIETERENINSNTIEKSSNSVIPDDFCNKQEVITNENRDGMPINSAMVAAVVNTGQGCAVTKAIAFRKEMNISQNEKVALLKHDILNSPYHVFGCHDDCARFTMTKRKLFSGPDDDYGAVEVGSEIIDIPFDEYQNKKEIFLKKITLKSEEIVAVERSTVGQQDNDMWQQYRKYRLTASNFGKVYMESKNESIVRNAVQETLGTIQLAGFFIHKSLHYLAASPDGLINEDSIIEIKCPSSIKEYTPQEAVTLKKLKYMTDYNGKLVLKKTDNYYFQVQGQLNIAEKKYCYFVVWSPKGFVIDKISRDESFWNTKIEPFVTRFYMDSLLPEIIDSRFDRGLPIRPGIPEK